MMRSVLKLRSGQAIIQVPASRGSVPKPLGLFADDVCGPPLSPGVSLVMRRHGRVRPVWFLCTHRCPRFSARRVRAWSRSPRSNQMRRVSDAIIYFRQWPSLKSQQEAIRGLEDLSNTAAKECIDEFNRLMRTVGPAVHFQVDATVCQG